MTQRIVEIYKDLTALRENNPGKETHPLLDQLGFGPVPAGDGHKTLRLEDGDGNYILVSEKDGNSMPDTIGEADIKLYDKNNELYII